MSGDLRWVRRRSTAIAVVALVALSVLAAGSAAGAATAGDRGGVHSVAANDTTAENVTIEHISTTTSQDGWTTSMPSFMPSQNLTFDNGSNYQVRLTNEDTNESVTLAVDGSATVERGTPVNPRVYRANGSVIQSPSLVTGPATVVNGSVPAASGLTNFSLALLDSSGAVLGQVNAAHVVGYEGTMTQNSTSGRIELSVPRDAVPSTADVRLRLGDNRSALHSSDAVSRTMTYDAGADAFTTVVDASELGTGNSSWVARFNWGGNQILYMSGTGSEGVAVSDPSDGTDGVTVRLSPSNTTVTANGTATYDVVVENVDAGVGSIGFDVSVGNTTVGTVESVSINDGFPSTFTTTEFSSSGSNVSVQVAGGDTADTGPVTVGNVTIRANAVGETAVGLSVDSVGDEAGSSYAVAGGQGATLTVEAKPPNPTVVGDTPSGDGPGEYAGDGLNQDVNGDGSVTLADVTALFTNYNSNAVQTNGDLFDYNGDGSITLADVTTFFNQVAA